MEETRPLQKAALQVPLRLPSSPAPRVSWVSSFSDSAALSPDSFGLLGGARSRGDGSSWRRDSVGWTGICARTRIGRVRALRILSVGVSELFLTGKGLFVGI
jgi:hypothetical protein